MKMYDRAVPYYNEKGNLLVPDDYLTEDGKCLGSWLKFQSKQYRAHKLADKKVILLDKIGMVWDSKRKKRI